MPIQGAVLKLKKDAILFDFADPQIQSMDLRKQNLKENANINSSFMKQKQNETSSSQKSKTMNQIQLMNQNNYNNSKQQDYQDLAQFQINGYSSNYYQTHQANSSDIQKFCLSLTNQLPTNKKLAPITQPNSPQQSQNHTLMIGIKTAKNQSSMFSQNISPSHNLGSSLIGNKLKNQQLSEWKTNRSILRKNQLKVKIYGSQAVSPDYQIGQSNQLRSFSSHQSSGPQDKRSSSLFASNFNEMPHSKIEVYNQENPQNRKLMVQLVDPNQIFKKREDYHTANITKSTLGYNTIGQNMQSVFNNGQIAIKNRGSSTLRFQKVINHLQDGKSFFQNKGHFSTSPNQRKNQNISQLEVKQKQLTAQDSKIESSELMFSLTSQSFYQRNEQQQVVISTKESEGQASDMNNINSQILASRQLQQKHERFSNLSIEQLMESQESQHFAQQIKLPQILINKKDSVKQNLQDQQINSLEDNINPKEKRINSPINKIRYIGLSTQQQSLTPQKLQKNQGQVFNFAKKPLYNSIAREIKHEKIYKIKPQEVLKVKGYQGEYFKNAFIDHDQQQRKTQYNQQNNSIFAQQRNSDSYEISNYYDLENYKNRQNQEANQQFHNARGSSLNIQENYQTSNLVDIINQNLNIQLEQDQGRQFSFAKITRHVKQNNQHLQKKDNDNRFDQGFQSRITSGITACKIQSVQISPRYMDPQHQRQDFLKNQAYQVGIQQKVKCNTKGTNSSLANKMNKSLDNEEYKASTILTAKLQNVPSVLSPHDKITPWDNPAGLSPDHRPYSHTSLRIQDQEGEYFQNDESDNESLQQNLQSHVYIPNFAQIKNTSNINDTGTIQSTQEFTKTYNI
eukprot:403359775